jgi:hypothetical protein
LKRIASGGINSLYMCDRVLDTVDEDGEGHHFVFGPPEEDLAVGNNYDEASRIFTYRAKTTAENEHFFEFTVQEEGQACLRVTMMNNHGREEYRGKGIPEALICMLARRNGITVTSSSNHAGAGQYRNIAADRIWQRLVRRKLARYNAAEDRYYAIAQPA